MSKKKIIVLISLIINLALIFVLVNPFWSSIKVLQKEIIQQKLEITALEELLAKTQQLDQEYQELEEEGQKIFLALPKEKDIPHLIVQFESLASSNGLLLESMDFSQITSEAEKLSQLGVDQSKKISPLFPSLFLDIKLTGSYDAFKGYLTALENNIRSMDIHSIKFTIQKKDQASSLLSSLGIFEFNLGVSVYYHAF